MRDEFKKYLQVLIVLGFICLGATVVSAQTTRLSFDKNSTAVTVSSNGLKGYKDRKIYVVKVRKGQKLETEQINIASAPLHYITVSIKNPSGKTVGDADASCNNRKEIEPTEAGDYTITITQCQKADAWRGRFRLKISVK